MPAKSKAQRRAAAIALHHPDKLIAKEFLQMSKEDLKKMAETPEKRLPARKRRKKY